MKLTDFDKKDFAPQALKENYKIAFDASKMSMNETKTMLQKVRGLAMEAKKSSNFYADQSNPAYMKLVFMEQALVTHYNELATRKPQIVVENEEVDRSQAVLAAQDMVDSVQKMVEDVSDMLVKELPALVDSIQTQIGVNESETFNSQVTEALSSLTAALTQSKTTLQSALNSITGQDTGFGDEVGGDLPVEPEADLGAEMGGAEEMPEPIEEPIEEPEMDPVPGAGRTKR